MIHTISDTRSGRAKLNIVFSLLGQFVTLICGIIVPRLLIGAFGSETYGATASIAQFLAYITLLEGGIGGVARAALYKPLAQNDSRAVSEILAEIKKFFRIVAYVFFVYVLILAVSFKQISGTEAIDGLETFLLVLVISISTFAEYFIGISYTVLLQAAQKSYITTIVNMGSKIVNTIFIVILVLVKSDIIAVKLVSSCIYVVKPCLLWLYVKKNFTIVPIKASKTAYLKDKWAGFAQHIAFFLHSNTDIAVLTVLGNLKMVAVYSVYYMIVSQMQNVCTSFAAGMEAVFGDMLAKEESTALHRTFCYYETLISVISTILFSVTVVMIVPFVRIYTAGINDTNYIEPTFAVVLTLASYAYCIRSPYHGMVIAAGHFKQTQAAAYGEAIINLALSLLLVKPLGLLGVAVGTLAATVGRMLYYAIYLRQNIFKRKFDLFVKRETVNIGVFALICFFGNIFTKAVGINTYFLWICAAAVTMLIAAGVTVMGNYVFYKSECKEIIAKIRFDRHGELHK